MRRRGTLCKASAMFIVMTWFGYATGCASIQATAPKEGLIPHDARNLAILDRDGSLVVYPDRVKDHRIFGYARPDVTAKKLLLLSSYTADVAGNPYRCALGAFYSSEHADDLHLHVNRLDGTWAEVAVKQESAEPIVVFILREWIRTPGQ